jgi:predicted RNA binding protein with dsRBD fold (UPF0201 family)
MKTNWEELAIRIGSISDTGESGGDDFAMDALQQVLGKEWIIDSVNHIISFKRGSELAMNTLRFICSKEAAEYAYSIYKSSSDERADRAVWLIKHIAHPISIDWVEEFLKDENVAHWGFGVLDQLIWKERISDNARVEILLQLASSLYDGALQPQVEFVRSYITERNSC